MELSIITAQQVAVLFVLILAGWIGVRTGVIRMESKKAFSNLLVYLVAPAMILNSYMVEVEPEILDNLLLTFGLSTVALLIGLGVALAATSGMKGEQRPILQFAAAFSNAAYMGFPLIQALFGDEGMIYASAFVTVFNILLWTAGYAIVTGKLQFKELVSSVLLNPVLISVAIGLVIYLGQIPIPAAVRQPFTLLGGMNTPLAMIITGMLIAASEPRHIFSDRRIYLVALLRMAAVPFVTFILFSLFGVSGMAAEVVLLLESCPSAAITSVFAVQFGYDEEFAAGTVVFTTVISIVILPLCALLAGLL